MVKSLLKKNAANKKVKSLKNNKNNNKIKKALQSRLEESVAFRKAGIHNMIHSTPYNNSKRIQEYMNELGNLTLYEQNDLEELRTKYENIERYKKYHSSNTNTLSEIQKSINNITRKLEKNHDPNLQQHLAWRLLRL
jgi:hypothetical protein